MKLENLLERDPELLVKFIVDPKGTLELLGVNTEDRDKIKRLELFALAAQNNLRASGDIVGIGIPQLSWGIGAGCCNAKLLLGANSAE